MHQVQATRGEAGYAMAALLVTMALMAVMMSVALPVWRQAAQREKEAELVWRGQQYDRALQLFRRKTGAPGPPNLDILIQQKFLRKKYRDPITDGDFELRPVSAMGPGTQRPGVPGMRGADDTRPGFGGRSSGFGNQTPATGNQPGTARQRESAGSEAPEREAGSSSSSFGSRPLGQPGQPQPTGMGGQRAPGQLIGSVRSKSKARSIRELNGRTRYDQWEFVYVPYNPNPQTPQPAGGRPGPRSRTPGQQRPGSTAPGGSSTGAQRPGATTSPFQ